MNRKELLNVISDVRAGKHNSETLKQAITETQLPEDTRGRLQLECLEKAGDLVQRQDPGFIDRLQELNKHLKAKYGPNVKAWPDEALDQLWDLYVQDPIYAKLLNLDTWLIVKNLKKFILWTEKQI